MANKLDMNPTRETVAEMTPEECAELVRLLDERQTLDATMKAWLDQARMINVEIRNRERALWGLVRQRLKLDPQVHFTMATAPDGKAGIVQRLNHAPTGPATPQSQSVRAAPTFIPVLGGDVLREPIVQTAPPPQESMFVDNPDAGEPIAPPRRSS